MEGYGLVDYELGVWEEQIVDIFIKCLNLLPPREERSPQGEASKAAVT